MPMNAEIQRHIDDRMQEVYDLSKGIIEADFPQCSPFARCAVSFVPHIIDRLRSVEKSVESCRDVLPEIEEEIDSASGVDIESLYLCIAYDNDVEVWGYPYDNCDDLGDAQRLGVAINFGSLRDILKRSSRLSNLVKELKLKKER